MQYPIQNIRKEVVPDNQILVYWLCGYGFMLKFPSNQILCIDPYLSDCVERIAGFSRLSLAPLAAQDVRADLYLITHDHPDHLDVDSFDTIIENNPDCALVVGKSCEEFLKTRTVSYKLALPGEVIQHEGITITATAADHGDLCPEAIGFIIQFENRSMYFTGDTGLNEALLSPAIDSKPEILFPCINPKFGNLGEKGSAELARKCEAKIAVPGHFGLFAEHGGDAGLFNEQLQMRSPQTKCVLLTPGRGKLI